MQLHLLIESPFYTQRIVDKMAKISSEELCFARIKSHKEVLFQSKEGNQVMTLVKLNRLLASMNISKCYVHFLSSSIAYILHKTNLKSKPVYWIMWGADFYGLPSFRHQYYLPKSKPFAWKNAGFKQKLIEFLGLPSSKYVMGIFKDIDFFVGYEEEYKLTQMALGQPMKFLPWEYYFNSSELHLPRVNQGKETILLGNSDDPMNNHLDVLHQLEGHIDQGQRIIIPVAGAPAKYMTELKLFQKNSKANFVFIERYLESEAFFKLMEEVSYIIYGHLRQQGVGTLLPLIYEGKKAFLWEKNPLKATLERWGLNVNTIDTLSRKDFEKLSVSQVNQNRKIIDQVLSPEADAKRWKRILS